MRRICLTLSCLLPIVLTGTVPATSQDASEITFWESVRNTDDPAELKAYLDAYPAGQYAPLARLRMNRLSGEPAGETQTPEKTDFAALVTDCDLWASHPADSEKLAGGVEFDWIDTEKALQACKAAVAQYPNVPRLRYLLARPLNKAGLLDEAAREVESAALAGYPAAMLLLGFLYRNGQGVPQDMEQALRWYEKAAENGNPLATTTVGLLYLEGKEFPQDFDKAAKWLLKAASLGEAQAMYNLGFMYLNGSGVPQDPDKGVQWLRQAAEKGYANAALELAQMYEQGSVVARNLKEAYNWYLKAAQDGSAYANYHLVGVYLQGQGFARYDEAAASFLFQALQGGYIIEPDQLAEEGRKWGPSFWKKFQGILKEEGFYTGALDGGFGPQTKRAVEALSNSRFVDTDRTSAADTDDRPMLVNIPELNVFPRPSVRANRMGAVVMGDRVTARRWHTDAKGDNWARVCTYRFCGWVAAEFLKDAPAEALVPIQPSQPQVIEAPITPETPTVDSVTAPLEGLGTLD